MFFKEKKIQKEQKAGPRGSRQMTLAAESSQSGLDGAQECH